MGPEVAKIWQKYISFKEYYSTYIFSSATLIKILQV